jgi:hypothetical protein
MRANLLMITSRLESYLTDFFAAADPYEAVGALIAREIIDRQLAELAAGEADRLAAQVRPSGVRQTLRPAGDLTSDRSIAQRLIQALPAEKTERAWTSAHRFWRETRSLFDDLYVLAYCHPGEPNAKAV